MHLSENTKDFSNKLGSQYIGMSDIFALQGTKSYNKFKNHNNFWSRSPSKNKSFGKGVTKSTI